MCMYICVYVCICVHPTLHILWLGEKHVGVRSFLPPCRTSGSNSVFKLGSKCLSYGTNLLLLFIYAYIEEECSSLSPQVDIVDESNRKTFWRILTWKTTQREKLSWFFYSMPLAFSGVQTHGYEELLLLMSINSILKS